MRVRCYLLGLFLALAFAPGYVSAEPPPLSKDELENLAALIVTGTVTEVKAGEVRARSDGEEHPYELTVLVKTVKKGKVEVGATLMVRASYVNLKPGYVGGTGHHWLKEVEPGWKLHLYLNPPHQGAHSIVGPNGVSFIAIPEKKVSVANLPWLWIVGVGVILGAMLLIGLWVRQRMLKRKALGTGDMTR